MTRSILSGLAAVALLIFPAFGAEQMGPLRAGAAKVDISPTKDMFPFHGFADVHDPLYARALVLDNGSTKVALISIDCASIPDSDGLVKAVTAELGIPAGNLSMSSTHDHNTPNGPSPGGRGGPAWDAKPYEALLKNGVLEAARQANQKLQPARIGFGTGKAYINTNRDEKIGDHYGMGYEPEGPTDKTVAVITVTAPSGDPIAVWSNYAVHGVVMFLSKTRDGQGEITGDIGGATASYVEDRVKGAISVWTPGAAGDQNPLFMSTYNQDAPDVHDEQAAGWALLDVQARRLGEEIVRVTKNVQNTTDRVILWGATASVTCPGQKREAVPRPVAAANTNGSPTAAQAGPAKMVDGNPVVIPLGLVMINDIALPNVSGEVFSEIGQHLKKDSLFDRTVMVTLSPGRIGYIPTDKAYLLPAAMAANNSLKPGCAEPAIVNAIVDLEKQYLPIWNAAH